VANRERSRHTDALAGGTGIEPDVPGQPVGAGPKARYPAAADVEFADEIEQPCSRGIEMSGRLGDLVAQALHRVAGLQVQ